MRLRKLFISAAVLVLMMFFIGCDKEQPTAELESIYAYGNRIKWKPLSEKMYFVSLSMRKIDSLSASMNLRFTRANIAGL